jgi:hypothetical protein
MGQSEMDSVRRRLQLRHGGQLRIVFEDPFSVPDFECVACSEKMTWEPIKYWWNCPDCGYELTPDEARGILQKLQLSLKLLKSDVRLTRKGFFTWLSQRLFGRRKRLLL